MHVDFLYSNFTRLFILIFFFLVEFSTRSCHLQIDFSFLIWMPFVSFSCLNTLASTSCTRLTRNCWSEQPCFVSDLREKAFNFSSLSMLAVPFTLWPLLCWGNFLYAFVLVDCVFLRVYPFLQVIQFVGVWLFIVDYYFFLKNCLVTSLAVLG